MGITMDDTPAATMNDDGEIKEIKEIREIKEMGEVGVDERGLLYPF